MVPYQTLLFAGYEVHVVCPGKKKGDQVKTAVHDFCGDQTYLERQGHNFTLTYDFDAVEPKARPDSGLGYRSAATPRNALSNPKILRPYV